MAQNTETPTLDETLNKTDFGHWVNENKRPILITAAVVVVLIIAYSVVNHIQESKRSENLDKLYKVETEVFTPFLDKKIKDDEFKTKLLAMENANIGEANLTPSFIESVNLLVENKQIDEKVLSFMGRWIERMNKKGTLYTLSALRYAAILEDNNKVEDALKILEGMAANKIEFMQNRVFFELGRLYKAQGNKESAIKYLEKVLEKKDEDNTGAASFNQYENLAKFYLAQLRN